MHYNAARDVNAISIAAVREFMAVQDRIRPALNCFSQEQHATNTDTAVLIFLGILHDHY